MKTINNAPTDRENLEWLVFHALWRTEHPCISISKGRELLGFAYMDDMRAWSKGEGKANYMRINQS
jgi:hypothetical protein